MPQSKYVTDFSFLKYYAPKAQQKIADILPEIEAAIDAGETNGRAVISWVASFSKHTKIKISDFRYVCCGYPHLRQITETDLPYEYTEKSAAEKEAIAKELNTLNTDFASARELFAKINSLEVLGKKEREARQRIKKDWTPAADMLKLKLEEIIAGTIVEFKKQIRNGSISRYNDTWDFIEKNKITTVKQFKDIWGTKFPLPDLELFIAPLSDSYTMRKIVASFPEQEVEKEATKYAENRGDYVASHFVSKNLNKLVSLLRKKTLVDITVHSLSVRNSAIHSSMYFSFNDGSSFEVRNKLVYGHSDQGTPFVKYPTTFHDVMVEGKPMSQPSELRVYDVFSGDKPPEE
jgi:hypothetical protein